MATEKVTYELNLRDLMSNGITDINKKLGAMEGKLQGVQKTANMTGKKMQSSFGGLSSLMPAMGIAGIAAGIGMLGKEILDLGLEAETTKTSFKVMLGSTEGAMNHITDLKDMAKNTPFEFGHLADASKILMQFGVGIETIMPTLGQLGDISLGNADKLNHLALAFGQTTSAGKLTGQDLLQYINAGFNPLQEISKKTGVAMAVLKEDMSKGLISAAMVQDAMLSATSKGGRFFNAMQEQSKTVSGRLSTLKDNFKEIGLSIAEYLLPIMGGLVDFTSLAITKLEPFKDLLTGIVDVFSNIGESFAKPWEQIMNLFGMTGKTVDWISFTFKVLATVIYSVLSPIVAVINALTTLVDTYMLLHDIVKNPLDAGKIFDSYTKAQSDKWGAMQSTFKNIWTDKKTSENGASGGWDAKMQAVDYSALGLTKGSKREVVLASQRVK